MPMLQLKFSVLSGILGGHLVGVDWLGVDFGQAIWSIMAVQRSIGNKRCQSNGVYHKSNLVVPP